MLAARRRGDATPGILWQPQPLGHLPRLGLAKRLPVEVHPRRLRPHEMRLADATPHVARNGNSGASGHEQGLADNGVSPVGAIMASSRLIRLG